MTVSPFDHPLLSSLLGDEEAARYFSADAEITAMLAFERALAEAEAENGIITRDAASAIVSVLTFFRPDMTMLRAAVARDGVVVPELVRQIRATIGEPHCASVHFAATSQDVVDTALVIRLRGVVERLDLLLTGNIVRLATLEQRFVGSPGTELEFAL